MLAKENGRAIVAMFWSTAFFMFNDATLKYTAQTMPLGEIIFLRGLVTTIIMGAWCWYFGVFKDIGRLAHPIVFGRSILEVIGSFMYLIALTHMPMANATAMLQAMPLAVTAGAAMMFGEVVGWRRWSAIAVGFAGVMLIIRPGMQGFDAWALLAISAVLFMALRDLITRRMPKGMPSSGVCFVVCATVTVMGLVMGFSEDWVAVDVSHTLPIAACSAFVIGAYYFAIASTRVGDMSVVSPMRYTGLLWATGIGVVVWGQVPDALTFTGMAVVVGSGLYTVHRERLRHRQEQQQLRELQKNNLAITRELAAAE